MNDPALTTLRDRLTEVRDSLAGEHMTTPASAIFARDSKRRTRRWLGATAAACTATGLAAGLTLASAGPARPGPSQPQLAAWTVTTHTDGTVTFTLRNTMHPARLQHALAEAGVPAIVRWGKICQSGGPGQPLMSTSGFLKGSDLPGQLTPGVSSWFAVPGGSGFRKNLDLGWSWTVIPSKIPAAGHFVISAVPGPVSDSYLQAVWEFSRTSAPITCARRVQP